MQCKQRRQAEARSQRPTRLGFCRLPCLQGKHAGPCETRARAIWIVVADVGRWCGETEFDALEMNVQFHAVRTMDGNRGPLLRDARSCLVSQQSGLEGADGHLRGDERVGRLHVKSSAFRSCKGNMREAAYSHAAQDTPVNETRRGLTAAKLHSCLPKIPSEFLMCRGTTAPFCLTVFAFCIKFYTNPS